MGIAPGGIMGILPGGIMGIAPGGIVGIPPGGMFMAGIWAPAWTTAGSICIQLSGTLWAIICLACQGLTGGAEV
jgi:hypothetical protein